MSEQYSISIEDLEFIATTARDDLLTFKNARFFMTGCTGFLGKWLIEALLWANEHLSLNICLNVLTRSASRFLNEMPHLRAHPNLSMLEACVTELTPETTGAISHIIHGANLPNDGKREWPLAHIHTAYEGTRRVLELGRFHNVASMLLMSSGAVYAPGHGEGGPPFVEKENGIEDYLNEPNVYANCKYFEELLVAAYGMVHGIRIPIARCFTFMGAHIPLHQRQALSSFLKDALNKRDIVIQGDGTAMRSYMYAADMVVWLMAILARGKHAAAYNVGSDEAVSVKELAQHVLNISQRQLNIAIMDKTAQGNAPAIYLPNISKITQNLKTIRYINLKNSLQKMWKHQ